MKQQLQRISDEVLLINSKQVCLGALMENIKKGKYEYESFMTFEAKYKDHMREWAESIGLVFTEGQDDTCGYISLP